MVENNKKVKFHSQKLFALAITISVVANFLFAPMIFAKGIELNEKEVERIKTGLDLMKALAAFTMNENKLKTILNTSINVGEASTDITYGLLALSALNEMDLIDLVVSQRYKTEATSYFNNILDERLNLINYYSGISYDIPRILSGVIKGPMTALTLNTFSITNKVIEIFIAFENIRTVKLYDGLWYYFDLRRSNESHETAWEEAKIVMGWAAISNPFRFREEQRKEEISKLESQFSTLWDKWGDNTTSRGIKEEVKEQAKEELRNSIVFALEKYELVQEEPEPSFLEKAGLSVSNFFASIANGVSSFLNIFTQNTTEEIKETAIPEEPEGQEAEKEESLTLEELQEMLDDAYERIDSLSQEKSELTGDIESLQKEKGESEIVIAQLLEEIEKLEADINETQNEEQAEEIEEEEQVNANQVETEQVCQKISGTYPLMNTVIINELAWMGTTNSANDEWIELKNISQSEVNLDGWQLSDKDRNVNISFNNQDIVPANGFFLLERTDDNSLPTISADLIYTGALGNTNETLYLFNKDCQLQDEVSANPDWPAGDNSSKRTMERKSNLQWQTSSNIGGTPKQENGAGYFIYYGSGSGGGGSTSSTPPPPSIPPLEILITEVQIASTSSTDDDFIELYNSTTTNADISGLQLKKKSSTGNEYSVIVFSEGTIIAPQSYFIWMNTNFASSSGTSDVDTSQTLSKNNSIALLDKDDNIIDALAWGSSTNPFVETFPFPQNPDEGQSLGRKWSTSTGNYIDTDNNYIDFQIQTPTPKTKNETKETENQSPLAYFTYNPRNPIVNEEVLLDASSSTDPDGNLISFLWDFGDNSSTSTSQTTTTHIFTSSSDFIVTLQVIDDKGATSSLSTTSMKIIESPIAEEIPTLSVVINEIAWMGTGATSSLRSDEWIELYNPTSTDIDLNNWTLSWSHEESNHTIIFSTSTAATTTIPGDGFYLIERTNDDTVKDVTADWTGSFGYGLNNDGEKIELRNNKGDLVDIVDCSPGWFAGKTTPAYISMERINANASGTDPSNWASNNLITRKGLNTQGYKIHGTVKSENSVSKSETIISESNPLPFNEFNELTLTYLGNPYVIDMVLHIPNGKILNIEPEVILQFVPKNLIHAEGTLNAIGKEGKEILLTSTNEENWSGIIFQNKEVIDQEVSQLEFVKINKAKRCLNVNCTLTIILGVYDTSINFNNSVLENTEDAAIGILLGNSSSTINEVSFSSFNNTALSIEGGVPEVKKCSFSYNNYGIRITKEAVPKIEENIFQNNSRPIYLEGAYPFFRDNIAVNNDYNGVLVGFGNFSTTTWQADLPYIIETNTGVSEGATLTIEPGAIIKLKGGRIGVSGKLLAQGNPGQPIIFTSLLDDEYGGDTNNDGVSQPAPGNWTTIQFATSSGSVLDNVVIRYGGKKGSYSLETSGAIALDKDVEISLMNSLVERNVYAVSFPISTGCETINSAVEKFKVDNTVFQDNEKLTYPVCP